MFQELYFLIPLDIIKFTWKLATWQLLSKGKPLLWNVVDATAARVRSWLILRSFYQSIECRSALKLGSILDDRAYRSTLYKNKTKKSTINTTHPMPVMSRWESFAFNLRCNIFINKYIFIWRMTSVLSSFFAHYTAKQKDNSIKTKKKINLLLRL